jgi:hypothetical protein
MKKLKGEGTIYRQNESKFMLCQVHITVNRKGTLDGPEE